MTGIRRGGGRGSPRVHHVVLGAVLALAAAASPARAANGDISTVAGTGIPGFSGDGGLAIAAQLNLPRSVALMPDGGYLIADRVNNRVRRVLPDGTITTVAGNGAAGFSGDGGTATQARIDFIHGAAPTPDGGFLISDTRNQRIRYVSPGGTISTAAGSGPAGSFSDGAFSGDGGPATGARLNNPHTTLAANPDGSFLIADTDNNRIRRVASDGTITTVAGSGPAGFSSGGFSGDGGPATSARLRRPFAVAPTPSGGFLITDTGNRVIRAVSATGAIKTVAGSPRNAGFSGDCGPAKQAEIAASAAVPTPGGGFLIADDGNSRIRWVDPRGTITTVAGTGTAGFSGDGGPATSARLNSPKGIAVTPEGFLIDDEANSRIRFVEFDYASPPPSGCKFKVNILKRKLRVRRGGRKKVRYSSTEKARIRIVLIRRGRRGASLRRRARAGRNRFRMSRRFTRSLRPGRHRLVLIGKNAAGQRDRDRARLNVTAPRRM